MWMGSRLPARHPAKWRKPTTGLTLIVTGDEDAVGPPSIAQELAGKIGGAKTVILNCCGHWTPIEKTNECGKLLSEFVRGILI
jgi:pimeloyl-ACP methyl ester carboxylesterase